MLLRSDRTSPLPSRSRSRSALELQLDSVEEGREVEPKGAEALLQCTDKPSSELLLNPMPLPLPPAEIGGTDCAGVGGGCGRTGAALPMEAV